jgi:hypothetical protein
VVRELAEEIGATDARPGPWIASREADLTLIRRKTFARERYFPVRLASAAVDTSLLAETEDDPALDVRWWAPRGPRIHGRVRPPARHRRARAARCGRRSSPRPGRSRLSGHRKFAIASGRKGRHVTPAAQ